MSKKGTKALASATLMSLVLTTALSAGPVKAAPGKAERIGAADRYATAAQVATKNWTTSDNVVLVSGEGYADAVSASALAKKLNAPILLTTAKTLSTDTASALSKLGAKNVYVVGGEASVSTAVRNELKKTYSLVELGGANRYETNVAVAQKLVDLGVDPSSVIMVGGEGFSDALSVAPVAAAKGQILLLGMNNADYMKPVLDFVAKNKSKVTVVGTKNVISEDILKTVNGTRVDGGKDRWDTNQKVLANFKDTVKMDKLYVASAAYNAQDNGYADALVASALAGKYAAPLVLVDKDGNEGTTNALNYIKNNAKKTTDLQVVGGTGVVSDSLLGKITDAVNPNGSTGDTTVKSIEATSLNQIKVVFGTDVDSDSAESVSNYKIDGTSLSGNKSDDNYATASLQDDNRTVLITLNSGKDQQKDYTVSVKNGVLVADKTKSITAFDQKVTFADTTAPTVSSVSVKGNSKLTIKFSEPVKMPVSYDSAADAYRPDQSSLYSKFKINGQNISSFGLDTSKSEVKQATIAKGKPTTGSTIVWADQIDFYFASRLSAGNNTLKISDGDSSNGVLVDAASFTVKEVSQSFNVDNVTTKPVVKEVKADADGTLWVRFDRPMDSYTATKGSNYGLNGDDKHIVDGSLKENDCTVKFKHVSDMNSNSNTLYISNSVKDAYGNKVDDNTRVSFTKADDKTAPTVTNVNMPDSETIRVTFSKDIDKNTAMDLANYKLRDSSNVDITSHIRVVKPSSLSVSDSTTAGTITRDYNVSDDNVWDIKMYKNANAANSSGDINDDWRLNSSKYSLTIKNLQDTTSNHNVMGDFDTTLNGTDDVQPKMYPTAYKKADSEHKVVVLFSKAMDGDSVTNKDNYKYKNGGNDTKQLPSDTKITIGNDNKSVTLEFPDSYYVNGTSDRDNDNRVMGILGMNLKDQAGNVIDAFNNSCTISNSNTGGSITYKDKTYRMESDIDDLKVRVQFTNPIDSDTLDKSYFTLAGLHPDSVGTEGSDLVLRFNKDSKIDSSTTVQQVYQDPTAGKAVSMNIGNSGNKANELADKLDLIKLYGANALLTMDSHVKDITGASVTGTYSIGKGGTANQSVWNYEVAPKTTSDYWYATTDAGIRLNATDARDAAAVVLTFDTVLDTSASKVKADDFRFNINGVGAVTADKVVISGNTLVFLFGDTTSSKFKSGSKNVTVSLKNQSIDVEALADGNGDNAKFVPSSDDKSVTRSVYTSDKVDLSTLKEFK